jgi:hypothetical protein
VASGPFLAPLTVDHPRHPSCVSTAKIAPYANYSDLILVIDDNMTNDTNYIFEYVFVDISRSKDKRPPFSLGS